MPRRSVKRMPRRQQKAVFSKIKRGKTLRYSINYPIILGKSIRARPIKIKRSRKK